MEDFPDSPQDYRWSLHDIDDIEQTIYMLNRPKVTDDEIDAFGWNSPIKCHRFASPKKQSKRYLSRQCDDQNLAPIENILPQPCFNNEQRDVAKDVEGGTQFLIGARKQLEVELAKQRNAAVQKLKTMLDDGARNQKEQYRQAILGKLVDQTDDILKQAFDDIRRLSEEMFASAPPPQASSSSLSKIICRQDASCHQFRSLMKKIKAAEQEKIRKQAQATVQQVATSLENLHVKQEKLATDEAIERYASIYDCFSFALLNFSLRLLPGPCVRSVS